MDQSVRFLVEKYLRGAVVHRADELVWGDSHQLNGGIHVVLAPIGENLPIAQDYGSVSIVGVFVEEFFLQILQVLFLYMFQKLLLMEASVVLAELALEGLSLTLKLVLGEVTSPDCFLAPRALLVNILDDIWNWWLDKHLVLRSKRASAVWTFLQIPPPPTLPAHNCPAIFTVQKTYRNLVAYYTLHPI